MKILQCRAVFCVLFLVVVGLLGDKVIEGVESQARWTEPDETRVLFSFGRNGRDFYGQTRLNLWQLLHDEKGWSQRQLMDMELVRVDLRARSFRGRGIVHVESNGKTIAWSEPIPAGNRVRGRWYSYWHSVNLNIHRDRGGSPWFLIFSRDDRYEVLSLEVIMRDRVRRPSQPRSLREIVHCPDGRGSGINTCRIPPPQRGYGVERVSRLAGSCRGSWGFGPGEIWVKGYCGGRFEVVYSRREGPPRDGHPRRFH